MSPDRWDIFIFKNIITWENNNSQRRNNFSKGNIKDPKGIIFPIGNIKDPKGIIFPIGVKYFLQEFNSDRKFTYRKLRFSIKF